MSDVPGANQSAMRDPRVRRLLVGQALSSFGDSALYLSLAIWVKELTGSNGAAATVFFALGATALLAPFGGYLVDRVRHRRRLLIATDAVTATAVLALVFVHSRADLWIVYAVIVAYGLSATVIGPATSALLKDLVDDTDLGGANAVRQVLGQGLRLVSPLVGAGLYAWIGGGALAVFDALTFAASIVAVAGLRIVESPPLGHAERPPLRIELVLGFRHIFRSPLLRRLAVTAGVAMLGLGLFESIDFAVVAALGHRPSYFGVLMSIQGAGSIAGGLVVTRAMRRIGEGAVVGLAMGGFAIASVGLMFASEAVVVPSVLVIGAAVSWYAVGFGTAMQRYTPPRLQGRVSTATFALTNIPQTVSIACGAALIGSIDYRALLGVLGALTLGCALALLRSPARIDDESDGDTCYVRVCPVVESADASL
jgi:MFS family permease